MEQIHLLPATKFNNNNKYKKFVEQINYFRLANYLINCGYAPQWLNYDSDGADLIALSYDQKTIFKIQLKSRVSLDAKYVGRGIYVAFPKDSTKPLNDWVIVEHDKMYKNWEKPRNWTNKHHTTWSHPRVTKEEWNDCLKWSIITPVTFPLFNGQLMQ